MERGWRARSFALWKLRHCGIVLKAASASREPGQPRRLLELRSQSEKLSFKRTSPILVTAVFKRLFLSSRPVNVPGRLITRTPDSDVRVGPFPGYQALRGCISR